MNRERLKRQAVAGVAIIALVLLTNETYRYVRNILDNMVQMNKDIAQLKRDQYVLQVQLDNQPVSNRLVSEAAHASVPLPLPFPMSPSGSESTNADASYARTPAKKSTAANVKSMVNVALISDADLSKASADQGVTSAKPEDQPRMSVQLIGESK